MQPMQLNIRPDQLEDVECANCGSIFFRQALILKKISGALVGKKEKQLVPPIGVFRCEDCGEVLKEFLPPGLMLEDETPEPPKSTLII